MTNRRPAALWRLLLAFVVMLATTLQVVPRPCGGHEAGGTCPASTAALCSCSCCTTGVDGGRTAAADQVPAGTFVERLCGSGGHVLRCIPLQAPPALAHVSLPSWRVPGLWVRPQPVTLTAALPPADLPPPSLGTPRRRAHTLLRPPDA